MSIADWRSWLGSIRSGGALVGTARIPVPLMPAVAHWLIDCSCAWIRAAVQMRAGLGLAHETRGDTARSASAVSMAVWTTPTASRIGSSSGRSQKGYTSVITAIIRRAGIHAISGSGPTRRTFKTRSPKAYRSANGNGTRSIDLRMRRQKPLRQIPLPRQDSRQRRVSSFARRHWACCNCAA